MKRLTAKNSDVRPGATTNPLQKAVSFMLAFFIVFFLCVLTAQTLVAAEESEYSVDEDMSKQLVSEVAPSKVSDESLVGESNDPEEPAPSKKDMQADDLKKKGVRGNDTEEGEVETFASMSGGISSDTEAGVVFINNETTHSAAPNVDTQTGAMTYMYPISIPPGRAGMSPDITLQYSSNNTSNTSAFGFGWTLSIPHIERVNKFGINLLYDANVFRSSLDGELLQVGTTTEYRPRITDGSFRKYFFENDVWQMIEKDGTVHMFGTTTQARRDDPSNASRIHTWFVEESRDTNDNYISYSYHKESGQIYPDAVTYTGNGVEDGDFSIEFFRESRGDEFVTYDTGFRATTTQRVKEIRVSVDNTWVRKYELAYSTGHNGNRSILESITDTGKSDAGITDSLPPTRFTYETYDTEGKAWEEDSSWDVPEDIVRETTGYDDGTRFVDINGDTRPDILRSWGTNWPYNHPADAQQKVYLHEGGEWVATSTWTIPVPENGRFGFVSGYDPGSELNSVDTGARFVDVNGDGYTDIVWAIKTDYLSKLGAQYKYDFQYVYINNKSDGWATTTEWQLPEDFYINRDNLFFKGFIADINGDGLPDLHTRDLLYFNTGNGWEQAATTTWQFPVSYKESEGVRLVDVNGDGLLDFVQATDSDHDDLISHAWLNTGNGWEQDDRYAPPEGFTYYFVNYGERSIPMRFIDVNGDGLVDLVRSNNADLTGQNDKILINTGEGWINDTANWDMPPYFMFDFTSYHHYYHAEAGVAQMDVNGDNLIDFVKAGPIESHPAYPQDYGVYMHQGTVPDLLNSIEYPEGGEIAAVYEQSARYIESGEYLNPESPHNLNTVNTITFDDGVIAPYEHTYTYMDGSYYVASSTDRQFAGFEVVTKVDARGNVTVSHIHQGNETQSESGEYADAFEKIGKPYLTEHYDVDGNLFTRDILRWESEEIDDDVWFVYNTQQLHQDYDGNGTDRATAETAVYSTTTGNLVEKKQWGEVTASTTLGLFTDIGDDARTTQYAYAVGSSTPVYDKVSTVATFDQSLEKVSESRSYYDDQALGIVLKGNRTKQEDWIADATYVAHEWTYNEYGLPIIQTDPLGNVTTLTYDSKMQYVATSTNAEGHETEYQYDYSSGKATYTTDAAGRIFSNVYDQFDRPRYEYIPDPQTGDSVVRTSAAYTDIRNAVSIKTENRLSGANKVATHAYYDGFGREVQRRVEGEDVNAYAVTNYVYGPDGLLLRESLPYFETGLAQTPKTTESNLYTEYGYDALGRNITVSSVVGTTTTNYDDWNEVVTNALGVEKEFLYDAYGRLMQVREHNGTSTYETTYAWNQNDNLIKITDALGNERAIVYDGLGRRTQLEDLHDAADTTYGIWQYAYDDAGNLATTTDPKGQVTMYAYDDVGRIVLEDYLGDPGVELSYTYDTCTHGMGSLCSVSNANATTTYSYNELGSVADETVMIDGDVYTTSYLYDRQNNITQIQYPNEAETRYIYNSAGLVESIEWREGSEGAYTDIVLDFDYSPTHMVRSVVNGNGVKTIQTYDPDELYRLRSIKTTSLAAPDEESAWFDENWEYRLPISIDAFYVDDTLSDFPVYINLSDLPSEFHERVKTDGADIRITAADGITEFPREVVSYDAGSDSGEVHFRYLEDISASEDSIFYLYYGNAAASDHASSDAYGSASVWDGHEAVFHMNDDGGVVVKDSSENAYHGTKEAVDDPIQVDALIGKGQNFDAPNTEYIATGIPGDTFAVTDPFTISAVVDTSMNGSFGLAQIYNTSQPINFRGITLRIDDGENVFFRLREGSAARLEGTATYADLNDGDSHLVTVSYDGTPSGEGVKIFVDTFEIPYIVSVDTLSSEDTITSSNNAYIGSPANTQTTQNYDGTLDEVRVRHTASDAAWVHAKYTNMFSSDSFYSVGAEEAYGELEGNWGSGAVLQDYTYTYDAIGNITSRTNGTSASGTPILIYTYDDLSRLTNVASTTQVTPETTGTIVVQPDDSEGKDTYYGTSFTQGGNPNGTVMRIGGWGDNYYSFIEMPLDEVPVSSKILSAELHLYANDNNNSNSAKVFRITEPWTESGVTKSAHPAATSTGMDWVSVPTDDWWIADVTDVVKDWKDEAYPNYGFKIQGRHSVNDQVKKLYSSDYMTDPTKRPKLVVTFEQVVEPVASSTLRSYTYDALGNILTKSDQGTYTYGQGEYTNPHAVTQIASTTLEYDQNGNLTSFGGNNYLWDYSNRLTAAGDENATSTYFYGPNGNRVQKRVGGIDTLYPSSQYNVTGGTSTTHISLPSGESIATILTTGTSSVTHYVHTDHLGSTDVVTDIDGVVETTSYYPFGELYNTTGSFDEQRKYIGEVYDPETELNYLNARYYDGARGQFTSQDPVFWEIGQTPDGKAALSNPQAQNSYSYAGNNPITNKDPSGRFWWVGFYDWSGYEGTSGALMKAGEVLGGHQRGMDAIRTNQSTINSASSKYGVDPSLTRAIIMEEQSHLLPGEGVKDAMFPDSQLAGYDGGVGVMQVSGRVGKDFGGYSKAELARNPSKNIDSGTAYLGNISSSRNTTNPATIGTAYNGASAYGQRIQSQMNNPNYNTNVVVYGLQKLVKSLNSYVKSLKK